MDIQNLVKLVVEHYQQSPRGPYKVTQALSKVKQDSATSTQRIILNTSELAWRAFFAAKKAADSNHGFRGQAELTRLLNILSTQATEDRQDFAQQLAHALEGADLQLTSQVEDTRPRSGPKRRCTATETEMPSPTTSDNVANSSTTSYIDVELYHSQRSPENRNLQGLHVNASLQASKTLFPPEFMDSIERIPHSWRPDILAADVSMILQKGYIREHFGCQMEIGIAKEKVPFYAKRLFDIEVETKDGVRYIRGPHGSKIEPQPSIKLRGCPQDAISGVFGNTLSAGISSGPIYQREVKEARDHTDGVSMTITNKGVEAGKITLFLGEWYAYTIKKELYD